MFLENMSRSQQVRNVILQNPPLETFPPSFEVPVNLTVPLQSATQTEIRPLTRIKDLSGHTRSKSHLEVSETKTNNICPTFDSHAKSGSISRKKYV